MSWLTPIVLLGAALAALIYKNKVYVWNIIGYNNSLSIHEYIEYIPSLELLLLRGLMAASILLASGWVGWVYYFGWKELARVVLLFLLWSSIQAKRCSFASESLTVMRSCSDIIVLTFVALVLVTFLDIQTTVALLTSWSMISSTVQAVPTLNFGVFSSFLILTLVLEMIAALLLRIQLKDRLGTNPWLKTLLLDDESVEQDLKTMKISYIRNYVLRFFHPSPPSAGHRLGSSSTELSRMLPTGPAVVHV